MYYSSDDINKAIVGQKFVSVREETDCLYLLTGDGKTHKFECEGDCCSHTFIEHLNVLTKPGSTITAIDNSFYEEREDGEEKYYKMVFKTTGGDIDVEYRNSSNGYYGGNLEYKGAL